MDKHKYTVNVWFIFPLLLILESCYDSGNAHVYDTCCDINFYHLV